MINIEDRNSLLQKYRHCIAWPWKHGYRHHIYHFHMLSFRVIGDNSLL